MPRNNLHITFYIKWVVYIHPENIRVHNLILNGVCAPIAYCDNIMFTWIHPFNRAPLPTSSVICWYMVLHNASANVLNHVNCIYMPFLKTIRCLALVVTWERRVLALIEINHWLGNSLIYCVIDCVQYLCANGGQNRAIIFISTYVAHGKIQNIMLNMLICMYRKRIT